MPLQRRPFAKLRWFFRDELLVTIGEFALELSEILLDRFVLQGRSTISNQRLVRHAGTTGSCCHSLPKGGPLSESNVEQIAFQQGLPFLKACASACPSEPAEKDVGEDCDVLLDLGFTTSSSFFSSLSFQALSRCMCPGPLATRPTPE